MFEYSVLLHTGDIHSGKVIEQSRKYIMPTIAAEIGAGKEGSLKGSNSFVELTGPDLIVNTIKLAEDRKGIVVRINNPTANSVDCKMKFYNKPKSAALTNMNEEVKEQLKVNGSEIALVINAYRIETIYLEF